MVELTGDHLVKLPDEVPVVQHRARHRQRSGHPHDGEEDANANAAG